MGFILLLSTLGLLVILTMIAFSWICQGYLKIETNRHEFCSACYRSDSNFFISITSTTAPIRFQFISHNISDVSFTTRYIWVTCEWYVFKWIVHYKCSMLFDIYQQLCLYSFLKHWNLLLKHSLLPGKLIAYKSTTNQTWLTSQIKSKYSIPFLRLAQPSWLEP